MKSTDVLEVWFSGCHTDVGGGEMANDAAHSLSNITLRWMVREIMDSTCGVLFDPQALARAGLGATSDLSTGDTERSADKADSAEPIHDHLAGVSAWGPLEILPLTWSVQDTTGAWHTKFGLHLGRGRIVIDSKPNFHITVKERMGNTALKYKPKAQWTAGAEVYVE
ncbi:hypothetical protein B0H15DRAFT_535876 [Mycena belliarum]|uniref:T6SS Phospholipase effector Tle1-like catalytic domain-containing protein n=1 Tax=Mycena belliarum TaxID=1033014 RepID=A0AAD6TT01_9AGAR|nr:hypothetical protein B0H15DRAFT_535876 [Mycena belliae]